MQQTLGDYIRVRARELGLSMSDVAERAGKSRQTVHALATPTSDRLPALETLMDVAMALDVHPVRLVQLALQGRVMEPKHHQRRQPVRGDKSIFVADVTIPDGTIVAPAARFVKTWRMQNVGTVAWKGRSLRCMDETLVVMRGDGQALHIAEPLRPTARSIAVPDTAPGAVVDLTVSFVAPKLPGAYLSYWKSFFEDGTPCMPNSTGLWCKVRVLTMTSTDEVG